MNVPKTLGPPGACYLHDKPLSVIMTVIFRKLLNYLLPAGLHPRHFPYKKFKAEYHEKDSLELP